MYRGVNDTMDLKKYAVLLLFQFKVIKNGLINKKRVCEERIYHIQCENDDVAYIKSLELGKLEEFDYQDGLKKVSFEFIGVKDLIELENYDEENLVWNRFIEKLQPMERKNKLIPNKNKLTVFNKGKKIKI
jgi:hypothetical protein